MKYEEREFYRLMNRAYIRDGSAVHNGESLILACLLHAKGTSRLGSDMTEVKRIMRDKNNNS